MEEKLLEEWQERLGLMDWAIALRYNCKFSDLQTEDACGETEWEDTIKCATIRIVSEEEHGDDRIQAFDFEKILVHELLHIKFGLISFTQDDYNGRVAAELRHQILDDLARALIMAKRGETKRKLAPNCKKVKDFSKKESNDKNTNRQSNK